MHHELIDFSSIAATALADAVWLLKIWIPGGRLQGNEYLARNPLRDDRHAGSLSVNVRTGRWSDFATGDRGGDLVSLYAYLNGLRQGEAARQLRDLLGVRCG